MVTVRDIWRRYAIAATALSCLFGAVVLKVAIEYEWLPEWLLGIADNLDVGLFTTALLGFTVELFLRKQLVRDVFEAAFGYLLPEELRPEIRWLSGLTLLCTSDIWIFGLSPLDDTAILLRATRTQTLENIGSGPQKEIPALAIDEWDRRQPSRIVQFSCRLDDQVWPKEGESLKPTRKEFTWEIQAQESFNLKPGSKSKLYIRSEFEEIKAANDAHIVIFKYLTKSVQVTVNAPADFGVYVGFARRDEPPAKKVGDTYVVEGTHLPFQHIEVRWWKENADAPKS